MGKWGLITPQLVASFLSGGFAGAVFTWLVNRPQTTIVTYAVTTTTMEESGISSIVPEISIQVGKERIKAIYVHMIELQPQSGPFVDNMKIAATFPDKSRIFGRPKVYPPTPAHEIRCDEIDNGIGCVLSSVTAEYGGSRPYRVILASDQKVAPAIVTAARGVKLLEAGVYQTQGIGSWFSSGNIFNFAMFTVAGLTYLILFPIFFIKRMRKVQPSLAAVVRTIANLEQRLPFVSVSYLDKNVFGFDPHLKKAFQFALNSGMLRLYKVSNPKIEGHAISACKLNRDHPSVKLALP